MVLRRDLEVIRQVASRVIDRSLNNKDRQDAVNQLANWCEGGGKIPTGGQKVSAELLNEVETLRKQIAYLGHFILEAGSAYSRATDEERSQVTVVEAAIEWINELREDLKQTNDHLNDYQMLRDYVGEDRPIEKIRYLMRRAINIEGKLRVELDRLRILGQQIKGALEVTGSPSLATIVQELMDRRSDAARVRAVMEAAQAVINEIPGLETAESITIETTFTYPNRRASGETVNGLKKLAQLLQSDRQLVGPSPARAE
ncbi:MAG TPA: hypothetical protein VJ302_08405 [Blastocatellia bacterium]|nr:hypothetical protein [Blastocatellia bacterium]